jgi:hypothetical protein
LGREKPGTAPQAMAEHLERVKLHLWSNAEVHEILVMRL